jgi:2-polyprenyl-3-methyl-5-hydroxy-6-metoxy-1,4-benzoquinol methylase
MTETDHRPSISKPSVISPRVRLFGSATEDYYERDRTPFLEWLGGHWDRVLEIGCGSGLTAPWLRRHGASHLTGVEIHEASAVIAATKFDEIHAMPVEEALARLQGEYDLVLCLDVLEHLVDPWSVLDNLRRLVRPDATLALSIPNIRFITSLYSLAIGPGFRYEPEGILDITHLRFFTRQDIGRMLDATSWKARRWGGPAKRFRLLRRTLRTATRGISDEWLTAQWFVTAARVPDRPAGPGLAQRVDS